ncbi:unextended protein isoform X2 [Ischnura elegans]|uniref:unextended protein isoform X2 n=1 Tax=Ischnura elegans TaxID=197161 RepID=UPI001ED8882E|nr:unextended protein isoform X2 [Ischnura elegans]
MAVALHLCVCVVIYCVFVIRVDTTVFSYKDYPIIESMHLINKSIAVNRDNETQMHLSVLFTGRNFVEGMSVISTPCKSIRRGSPCFSDLNENGSNCESYEYQEQWTGNSVAVMSLSVPFHEGPRILYACTKARTGTRRKVHLGNVDGKEVIKWVHQGLGAVLKFNGSEINHDPAVKENDEHARQERILRANAEERSGSRMRWKRRAQGAAAPQPVVSTLRPAISASQRPDGRTRGASDGGAGGGGGGSPDYAYYVPPPDETSTSTAANEAAGVAPSVGSVYGLRVETSEEATLYDVEGVPEVMAGTRLDLRLIGSRIAAGTLVAFTPTPGQPGGPCEFPSTSFAPVEPESVTRHSAVARLRMPSGSPVGTTFYLCLKVAPTSQGGVGAAGQHQWVHQGSDPWLQLRAYERLLPLWLGAAIIVVLLCLSGLFSGLNLGLMALDRTELKIVANTGTDKERKYARAIEPVRSHGNYLLCSLLLGNVLVNSSLTILMDDLTSGLIAVIFSTLAIVIFGEIIPQAICSRHGLAVGANTVYITKLFMVLTFPLSFPISKILDKLLGKEIGNVYNRERLKELVKVTNEYNDLENDEVNIIAGALELKKKMVSDVMTKLEDAFMLSIEAILDFETVSEIMKQGYSRIPVYEGTPSNVVSLLYIKDLAFVDPDDNTPLKTLCQFYQNSCNFVFEDTTLDVMFKEFKLGIKGHMALVHRVNAEGEGDPFYETVGLVTLEDVIEELIQSEIVDETDVWTDNRTKRRRKQATKQDFTVFAERRENQRIHISPQLTLAAFQYLSTSVEAFKPDLISETILRRLLKQDIIHHVKVKNREKSREDPYTIIYVQGKPVDYFVLILEGRVEVTVGRENMMFESGPFTYFGSQALTTNVGVGESPTGIGGTVALPSTPLQGASQPLPLSSQQQTPVGSGAGSGATPGPGSAPHHGSLQSVNLDSLLRHTFVPDYSVRAITDVVYIRIRRSMYLAAKRASLMERSQKGDPKPGLDLFENELERSLNSGTDSSNAGST